MNATETILSLCQTFPDSKTEAATPDLAVIAPEKVRAVLSFLKDKAGYPYLMFLSAVDRIAENKIDMLYMLANGNDAEPIRLKATLDRAQPKIDTISDLYLTADWHEREAAEMFGITFTNHPDPRPFLLWEGFEGFPLRKDFKSDFLQPLPTGKKEE